MVGVQPDLFIGLVTHPRTRFPESSGPEGLANCLARELQDLGRPVEVSILDEDRYLPEVLVIDRDEIDRSVRAELQLEEQWRRYLGTAKRGLGIVMRLRLLYRRRKFVASFHADAPERSVGFQMVRRLINIELAHMALMNLAVEQQSAWILIIEDDASCSDVPALAASLDAFIQSSSASGQPKYLNISESFDHAQLNIEDVMHQSGSWNAAHLPEVQVLVADRPVTNTVCAILYRGAFLGQLVEEMNTIPLSPVVPIDWKLNRALMHLNAKGAVESGDCWTLSPAPIIQSSMHSA